MIATNNPIAREALTLREQYEYLEQNDEVVEKLQLSLNGNSIYLDIAVLTHDRMTGERVVRFISKDGEGGYRRLDTDNPQMEA